MYNRKGPLTHLCNTGWGNPEALCFPLRQETHDLSSAYWFIPYTFHLKVKYKLTIPSFFTVSHNTEDITKEPILIMCVLVKMDTFNQGIKAKNNYMGNIEYPEELLGSIEKLSSKTNRILNQEFL